MGQTRPLFVLFAFFSYDKYSTNTKNEKSIDGVVGTQTQGGRMVGAEKSTELWRHSRELLPKRILHLLEQHYPWADIKNKF